MKRLTNDGFTAIEILVLIAAIVIIALVATANIRNIRAENRDEHRKTDINSMYYQLESYYETNGSYPDTLNESVLKGINPESLKDTTGIIIGEPNSEYIYKPRDCSDSQCRSYKLSAPLEREADFIKESLNS